ncbi:MAG TPA: APC family permease [Clostridiales bacterium]|nr:APC family permease [Clostridiales bacterium]
MLKRRDIFLGMICVMFFLDTVGPVASMGASAITWSLVITLLFVLPSGLIMAELGANYPAEGGMYAWVKMAYGPRWGARMSWLYWANNAIWISSTTIFTVSVFCQIFIGEIGFLYELIMSIILVWLIIFVSMRPLRATTLITNLAAVFKITVTVGMALMAVIYLAKGHGVANDLSLKAFTPRVNESFLFLSALVYNYMGFEVMSSSGNRIKNPRRDIPRVTIINAFMVSGLYVIAILAIIIIVPAKDMSIVNAIMNCFLFADLSAAVKAVIVYGFGLIFLSILFAQAITWISAAGRLAAGASKDGELPRAFGVMHKKNDTPMGALLITGAVGTVLAVIYSFVATNAADLFWSLFSFTNIIFLIPYIINYAAFLKLKKTKPGTEGAYKVPGPPWVSMAFARTGQFVLLLTIAVIIFTPGSPLNLFSCSMLIVGTLAVLVLGEIFIRNSQKKGRL